MVMQYIQIRRRRAFQHRVHSMLLGLVLIAQHISRVRSHRNALVAPSGVGISMNCDYPWNIRGPFQAPLSPLSLALALRVVPFSAVRERLSKIIRSVTRFERTRAL